MTKIENQVRVNKDLAAALVEFFNENDIDHFKNTVWEMFIGAMHHEYMCTEIADRVNMATSVRKIIELADNLDRIVNKDLSDMLQGLLTTE